MSSSRKRRYQDVEDSSTFYRHSPKKPKSEGRDRLNRDEPARDLWTRDRRARTWGARDQREADRRIRDQRPRDRRARHSRRSAPSRRRRTDKRFTKSQDQQTSIDHEPLCYMALKEICNSTTPENGILDLANKQERFRALLSSKDEIRRDLMQLMIEAIHLCCSTKCVSHHSELVLRLVIETKFLQLHLSGFLSRMLSFWSSNRDCQPSEIISLLSVIFLEMLKRFGSEVVHSIPTAQFIATLEDLVDRNVLHNVDTLQENVRQIKAVQNEIRNHERSIVLSQENQGELEPPENFRDLSVVPKAADFSIGSKPFLRANVVKRGYKNLEHYLDVQFRLLREDFMLPLRDGVLQLRKDNGGLGTSCLIGNKEAKNVFVYRDVTVLYPVYRWNGIFYRIHFDSFHQSLKHISWNKSKRFKRGALLCLSADDFYTPLFAIVEGRDAHDLSRGELDVRFEHVDLDYLSQSIETKKKFDMVESPAFFEAYRHVLEALQEIETADGLPFQEHIVHCQRNTEPPVHEQLTSGYYDLTGIVQLEQDNVSCLNLSLFNDQWINSPAPALESESLADFDMTSEESSKVSDYRNVLDVYNLQYYRHNLQFNDSQRRAFQLALTKRFAIIQGPPGTGKTYVGQKIAHALLQTPALWEDETDRTPMMMVSYTNHALDQFLEGLLPMSGIVRAGGRSKSRKLEPFLLRSLREQARESKETPGRIMRARRKTRRKMREITESENFELSLAVMTYSRRGVLSFQVLKQFMSDSHAEWFKKDGDGKAVDVFCEWLGVEKNAHYKIRERNDDDFGNEDFDFQRLVSFRTFANEDDADEEEVTGNIKESDVVICDAERAPPADGAKLRENLFDESIMSEDVEKMFFFPQWLTPQQRWELYRLWPRRTEKHHLQQLKSDQPDYEKATARLQELLEEENFHILQKARVIGMTTTFAAKNRRILQRICPKIVLVEEAAEVLEAHIITSMTKECQHLIMIGDHQQLRPNPAVYELAKKYKLDVSLFERMVNAKIPCERLSVQHRMRPEIAALMRHIYEDLENHESVEQYEDIKGMKKNMFFINHHYIEKSSIESHSHTNEHEVRFLVCLCGYLLKQGYTAEKITILTTYAGQMFAIRDSLRDENDEILRSIRLSTVDNFQGEENDIILLSLVRSNKEEKAGFIKMQNRACVALSRARKGLYCIGNFDILSSQSELWRKIVWDLKANSSIGKALALECQSHHTEALVKTEKDFREEVPHGGCLLPCKVRLKCGHVCKKLCHPDDIEHELYRCKESCRRKIKGCNHPCRRLCCEDCETDCTVPVLKILPFCGHIERVCCGKKPSSVTCSSQCKETLLCGHLCQEKCGKPCTKQCRQLVNRCEWPCGHDVKVSCSATPADCPFPCRATLECGHRCCGTCGECRMGRIHKRCKLKCGRVLVCSHVCKEACIMPCPPCSRNCENRCMHSDCRLSCGEPCVPCKEKCPWDCRHMKCSTLCGEFCDRRRCNEPCQKTLPCGRNSRISHVCRGLCGEPCICAICQDNDGNPITEIFFGTEDEPTTLFVQLPDCKHIFAAAELDKYMDSIDSNDTGSHVIELRSCPRCKTPIRTSLRYGNVIKQRLQDIEKVKIAAHGHPSEMTEVRENLRRRLDELSKISLGEDRERDLKRLARIVDRMAKGSGAVTTENQVTLMERYSRLCQRLNESLREPRDEPNSHIRFLGLPMQSELDNLRKRFMSFGVTERELRDINRELTRLNVHLELNLLLHNIKRFGAKLKQCYIGVIDTISHEVSQGNLIQEGRLGEMLKQLGAISQNYRFLSPLTEEETREIVSAMNLSQGRWYKCPQGHIYSIAGCGRPVQQAICPECRNVIGGRRYQPFEGNMEAPEMGGMQRTRQDRERLSRPNNSRKLL